MTKKTQIINFILNQPGKVATKKELAKFICSLEGRIYNPIKDRGIWCLNFLPPAPGPSRAGYLMTPSKVEHRYLYRISRGLYGVKGAY